MKALINLKILFFILFFLFLALSQDAFSQDFSSINQDLNLLESLIIDTLANTEEQQRLLEDLKQNLIESGILIDSYKSIIQEQENLLSSLRIQLNEMSETYRMQSQLSARYEQRSRFWRTFTIIAIPVTAIISGSIFWLIGF